MLFSCSHPSSEKVPLPWCDFRMFRETIHIQTAVFYSYKALLLSLNLYMLIAFFSLTFSHYFALLKCLN